MKSIVTFILALTLAYTCVYGEETQEISTWNTCTYRLHHESFQLTLPAKAVVKEDKKVSIISSRDSERYYLTVIYPLRGQQPFDFIQKILENVTDEVVKFEYDESTNSYYIVLKRMLNSQASYEHTRIFWSPRHLYCLMTNFSHDLSPEEEVEVFLNSFHFIPFAPS